MNRESYEQISKIFLEACELKDEHRQALLNKRCGGDAELRAAVEALLLYDTTHHEDPLSEDALQAGLQFGSAASRIPQAAAGAPLPDRIGRYRILGKIGEGGMGTVYLAEQDHPHRRVALKMIRPGALSRSLLRRFRFEADVLGRLQHPGIAQIYEAGEASTDSGLQPYFAMEYVEGIELRQYAKQQGLGTRARLELIARTCDAIHHAHQKGIIHRDLKPDNVLVVEEPASTMAGDAAEFTALGLPKVLDFGVARATDSDIQVTTMRTDVGHLVGTLTYMSPEQVVGDSRLLDVRSDLYALGVILFELLVGHPPFDVRHKSIPEAARLIREEEPTRLGSINHVFRGDVDTIVSKALEKDLAHRYQSAAELAADIRRYLANEPITAHPPSTFYQLRKFAKRNRALVGGLAMSVLILLAGVVSSLLLTSRAVRGEKLARQNEQRASVSETAARRTAYRLSLVTADAVGDTDPLQALQYLRDTPAEYRGWEWHHLRARFERHIASHTGDHLSERCATVAARPDGTLVAALERGGGIRLIELQSGDLVAEFRGDGETTTPSLAPDAALLAAVLVKSRELVVWNVASKEIVMRRPLGLTDAQQARFSPDGSLLVYTSPGEGAIVVEVPTGRVRFTTAPAMKATACFAFDPTGQRLALTSFDGEDGGFYLLHVFSTQGDRLVSRRFADGCEDLAFSPDGTRLAVGTGQRLIRVLDAATLDVVSTLHGHTGTVLAVGYSPNGELLASSSTDGTTRIWRLPSGETQQVLVSHWASSLVFGKDNQKLAAGSTAEARLWDGRTNAALVLRGHTSYVYFVSFNPDGTLLASSAWDDSVRIWDALTGEPLAALPSNTPYVGLSFTRDGSRILAVSMEKGVEVWDAATDEPLTSPRTSADAALLDVKEDKLRRYMRAATGGARYLGPIVGLREATSNDCSLAVSLAGLDGIRLDDWATGQPAKVLAVGRGPVTSTGFDRTASRLFGAAQDGTIYSWDIGSGAELAALKGHVGLVFSIDVSPDDTRLASSGNDETIRLWDAASHEPVAVLRGHTSYVHCVHFSPDGAQLASASGDGTVRIWDSLPPQQRMARIRHAQALRREAEPLVERLLRELDGPSAVANLLRGDATLPEELRHQALVELLRRSSRSKPR